MFIFEWPNICCKILGFLQFSANLLANVCLKVCAEKWGSNNGSLFSFFARSSSCALYAFVILSIAVKTLGCWYTYPLLFVKIKPFTPYFDVVFKPFSVCLISSAFIAFATSLYMGIVRIEVFDLGVKICKRVFLSFPL